jgi:hypothetical protein
MGERRDAYKFQVMRSEGKRKLGRPWRRREGNMKIDIQEVGLGHELD